MGTYTPKRKTANGTEDVHFPISAIEGLEEALNSSSGGSLEMPQIRFGNAIYSNMDKTVNDENPLKLRVEIVGGGALQVGDRLQICVKRTYGYKDINNMPYRKQKLRMQCEYEICEDDLGKRFLTVTTDFVQGWLFKNDRNRADTNSLSAFYLRIKRPIYKETANGYLPVDAIFSNVITVWKAYNQHTNELSIK